MVYYEFLEHCIDDGIAAVNKTYVKDADRLKLKGSIAGFEACRNKTAEQLERLLVEAGKVVSGVRVDAGGDRERIDYWYFRYYELQVEGVCDVVGAMLDAQGGEHNF